MDEWINMLADMKAFVCLFTADAPPENDGNKADHRKEKIPSSIMQKKICFCLLYREQIF